MNGSFRLKNTDLAKCGNGSRAALPQIILGVADDHGLATSDGFTSLASPDPA
ncbi:hypothetical protein OEG84_09580 [Hoeflea sp. G2-23]|uniref:Uncharacterized protein n=1 Tax=Hoeflea algicola TaxID=2983763 RepID=A0ABT3Z9L3_9HYPH|nr:hypothetical protein [Hoeflea algicola]MCY0147951.1 hypothetical protein [Hoeflea algicola]